MAYVVARPGSRWELRRSKATPSGPRSETLLTFRELTDEGVERAAERGGLSAHEVRAAAHRAGAPVALDPVRRSAAELLRGLQAGGKLPAGWSAALREALADERNSPGAAGDTIAEWAGATPERRGAALRDLLLLADAVRSRPRRGDELRFPGFSTGRERG